MRDIKWFSGNPIIIFFKALLISFLCIALFEFIIINELVNEKKLTFLVDSESIVIFCFLSVTVLSLLTIHILVSIKKSVIALADIVLFVLVLYFFVANQRFDYYPSDYAIKYSHSLVLILFGNIIFMVFKKCKKKENPKSSPDWKHLISDASIKQIAKDTEREISHIDKDTLQYMPIANKIFDTIENVSPSIAFTIGINGTWGSGKSSVIDMLEEKVLSKYNNRWISLNTWLYPDQQSLMKNLFNEIKSFYPYKTRLHLMLDDYLFQIEKVSVSGINFNLKNLLFSNHSLKEIKNEISNVLRNENDKKLIVVLDDLDRLTKDEILDVANLVRAVADFPNVIYLLCYDRDYVDDLLSDMQENNQKHTKYFDKIINLEFKIPSASNSKIKKFLKWQLGEALYNKYAETQQDREMKSEVYFREKYGEAFEIIDKFEDYEYFLPNIRDVKRFLNSFLILQDVLKENTVIKFHQVFFLDLFFYKFSKCYKEVYRNRKKFLLDINKEAENNLKSSTLISSVSSFSLYKLSDVDMSTINKLLDNVFVHNTDLYMRKIILMNYYSFSGIIEYNEDDINDLLGTTDENLWAVEIQSIIKNGLLKKFTDLYFNKVDSQTTNSGISKQLEILLYSTIKELKSNNEYNQDINYFNDSLKKYFSKQLEINKESFLPILKSLYSKNYVYQIEGLNKELSKFNSQTIVSDEKTLYVSSTLEKVSPKNPYDAKVVRREIFSRWYNESEKVEQLKGVSWICRVDEPSKLDIDECDDGNYTFIFKSTFFSLTDSSMIKSAELFVLADDEVNVVVNANKSYFRKSFYPELYPELKNPIRIEEGIVLGENTIIFEVKNYKVSDIHSGPKGKVALEELRRNKKQNLSNPYGLIFKLIIKPKEVSNRQTL